MNYNNLCYKCFYEKPIRENPCPKCGYKHTPNAVTNCLLPGTLLKQRYVVGVPLGVGGFGITYKCLDTKIGGICAIKEYFPANFAMRSSGNKTVAVAEQNLSRFNHIMKRFVEEAQLVSSLKHRNVIEIYDSFFENRTAYYVMEYCDGIDLRKYTADFTRKLSYEEGMNILFQVMNGLEYIHSKGILHRDIAPDNIYITQNKSVKILDFGAARSEMDQYNRELSVIVKVGYAPIEQYGGNSKQGSYTDVYALGATFYHLFTSRIPLESTQRVAEDNLVPVSDLRPDLPDNLRYCLEKAMAVRIADRISDIPEMKKILGISPNAPQASHQSIAPPRQNRSYQPQAQPNVPPQNHIPPQPQVQHGAQQSAYRGGQQLAYQAAGGQGVHQQSSQHGRQPAANRLRGKPATYRIANLSMRMGAYAIDLFIWLIIYFIGVCCISTNEGVILGLLMLFPVVFTLINTVFELITSTTIGKSVLRLYVRGKTTPDVMPSQILMRNVVKVLGVFVVVFAIGDELLEDRATDSIVCIKE